MKLLLTLALLTVQTPALTLVAVVERLNHAPVLIIEGNFVSMKACRIAEKMVKDHYKVLNIKVTTDCIHWKPRHKPGREA